MTPKIAFIEDIDNNDSDFKIVSYGHISGTSRLFANN